MCRMSAGGYTMNRKSAIFLLVLLLAGGGYYYYRTQLSSSFLSMKKMKVNCNECTVRSPESLKKIGLTLRRISNKDNAAVLYVKASNLSKKPEGALDDTFVYVAMNQWINDPVFTRWFDENKKCLKLVHRAVRKPDCEFPVFGKDDEPAYNILLPHLTPIRAFARLLSCEGKRYEQKRDYSRALDSYFAITPLAEHLHKSNAVLITDLVVIACHSIRNRAVERCLANRSLSEEDLQRVIKHYEALQGSFITLADCLKREKHVEDSMLEETMRNPSEAVKLLGETDAVGDGPVSVPDDGRQNVAQLIQTRGAEMKAAYERDYTALKRWSALPAWQAFQPGRDWDAYINSLPRDSFFSRRLLGALGKAKGQYVRNETEAGGILLVAAIKLHEKKNGRPPSALSELVPACLSQLPKDPCSGRDYIYKVRGRDWILYSVWYNLTDDGGAGSWPREYRTDKDLVFSSKPIPVEPPPR
jgi:hypothetical protein